MAVRLTHCRLSAAGPVADECLQFARDFRLDERLAASVAHASALASLLVAGPLAYVAARPGGWGAMQAARRPLLYTMLAGAGPLQQLLYRQPVPGVKWVKASCEPQVKCTASCEPAVSVQHTAGA